MTSYSLADNITIHGALKSVDAHAISLDKELKATSFCWLYRFNPNFLENPEKFFSDHLHEIVMSALSEVLSQEF